MNYRNIVEIIDKSIIAHYETSGIEPTIIEINWYDIITLALGFASAIDLDADDLDVELLEYRGLKLIGSEKIKRGIVIVRKDEL